MTFKLSTLARAGLIATGLAGIQVPAMADPAGLAARPAPADAAAPLVQDVGYCGPNCFRGGPGFRVGPGFRGGTAFRGGWNGPHRFYGPGRYYGPGYWGPRRFYGPGRYYGPGYWGGYGSGFVLGFGVPGFSYYGNPWAYGPPVRPVYRAANPHVRWCYSRYRSYRAWDNTFQPNYGPRRQCISPYRY